MKDKQKIRSRARESRAAIERMYIAMRHLFIRGSYKPLGVSGESLIDAMKTLSPEIYGSVSDPERVELDGLLYVFQRLPQGIEDCRYIRLITREGYEKSNFDILVPPKRRRNCYRIDSEQMFIEMTRGRSDVYDVLTHLTFMYIEAEKIRKNSTDHKGRVQRDWQMLERIVEAEKKGDDFNKEVAFTYLSKILNQSYVDTVAAAEKFEKADKVNSLFYVAYNLGKRSMEEAEEGLSREISFSRGLREKIGHHIYGEIWANKIKEALHEDGLIDRPLHIISANMHSVMNCLYAREALQSQKKNMPLDQLASILSQGENEHLRQKVKKFAERNGMRCIEDTTGTNIEVQIIDITRVPFRQLPEEININARYIEDKKPVILVMDYAFGEQAYESMDELLKPYVKDEVKTPLNVKSIAVMGKAGILTGEKGDIMVANSHVFEGTADNYPVDNEFSIEDFEGHGMHVVEGTMITVLGTSLQNKDILRYFYNSSWRAVGLEMEGAHYQKAIQSASKIRGSVSQDIKLLYAYYASDNPLISGQTLASGSLGLDGVKPTYLITVKILSKIMEGDTGQKNNRLPLDNKGDAPKD